MDNGQERLPISIPDIVVGRLPLYLRALQRMAADGRQVTSSQELGERLGISAAQIRKDLSLFGEFGKQGTGYRIDFLLQELSCILHVDRVWEVVVIGAGDVGHALARYQGFANRGFKVGMVFDSDPQKIGTKIGNHTIQDIANLPEAIRASGIKIALLAVPAPEAQKVTDLLTQNGVRSILNYAPTSISAPADVKVQYIDPVISLQRMTYYID